MATDNRKKIFKTNEQFLQNKFNKTKNIILASVIDIIDNNNQQKIICRVRGLDDGFSDTELPSCFPFLPLHLNILPKRGEVVRLIIPDTANPYDNRYWLGPVITQYQNLNNQQYLFGTKISIDDDAFYTQGRQAGLNDVSQVGTTYPLGPDDVSLLGRNNTEVRLSPNKVSIKAGKHRLNEPLIQNRTNAAQLDLFYDDESKSHATVFADFINLASPQGVTTVPGIIDQNSLKTLEERLKPIAFGDELIKILRLIISSINNHVHPYNGVQPIQSTELIEMNNFNLNNVKSNKVKAN